MVLNIENTGRVDLHAPKICGHTSAVMDIQFCPHNEHVIASASEDCTVKVWEIPEGGLTENVTKPVVDLQGHQRRVGIVQWHPTAENILFSVGFDYMIMMWNVGTGECIREIAVHSDTIYSISFNWNGSLFATTCKDKKLRIIDPRKGEVVQEGDGHKGTKPSRVVWCGTMNKLFTTGFSRMSERQYGVWDPEDLSKALKQEMIDTSSGVLFPYWDDDTKMLFVGGKGDGNIRYFEITNERPYCHYLNEFKTSTPQRGLGMFPKTGLRIGECEVARFYKLQPKGLVEVIGFTVPRKATIFQEDIFPPTKEASAVMTADEFLSGTDRDPVMISLKDGYKAPERAKFQTAAKVEAKKPEGDAAPKGEKELLKAWHAHVAEIKELKAKLATAEIKIRSLSS